MTTTLTRICASRLWPIALTAGLAATFGSAGIGASVALPPTEERWAVVVTPSFEVVGNVSDARLTEIAEGLELFRAALARLKPESARTAAVPTLVLAFAGEAAFAPYLALDRPDTHGIRGVFHRSAWGQSIAFDAGTAGESELATVYHEYVHYFTATGYPRIPLWLNEGLAELYSTFQALSGGIEIGRPASRHVQRLRDGKALPLARMLAVTEDSADYVEPRRAAGFYAQAWAFAHFLFASDEGAVLDSQQLLTRLDRGEAIDSAVRGAFGFGLAELGERLDAYVRRGSFRYRVYPLADLRLPTLPAPVALARGTVLTLLAEHLAHAGDEARAAAHLAAVPAGDAATGDALALSAFLAERRERLGEARELYRRSAAAGPRRASSWMHAASFALEHDDAATARRAAARALALAPELGEAWAVSGLAALRAGDAAAAVDALTAAERLLPERADIAYNLFLAHLEAGELGSARRQIEGNLAKSATPERVAEARRILALREATNAVNAAIDGANRAAAAGDLEAAAAAMRAALEEVPQPDLRRELERRLAELEHTRSVNRQVESYNRAVELANSGHLAEARRVVAGLLRECGGGERRGPDDDSPESANCRTARALAAELDRRLAARR